MKLDITIYVQSCTTCQHAKNEKVKLPGPLQSLPISPDAWHTVGLDLWAVAKDDIFLGRENFKA
jgi:hypothetical protein